MFTMRDVLVEEERRRDEMRQAEHDRFVRQIAPVNKFKCYMCIKAGNALVGMGRRLQTRYVIPGYTAVSEIQMQLR